MLFNTINKLTTLEHPWPPFIPHGAKRLLLGTFPTATLQKVDFYYPNPKNRFWKIIADLANKQLLYQNGQEAVDERKALLESLFLAVADMGQKVIRQSPGSSDSNLIPLKYTDIFSILCSNPSIENVVLTSSSGFISALGWFRHYCHLNGKTFQLEGNDFPHQTSFELAGRIIRVHVVCSPSSRVTKYNLNVTTAQYKKVLCDVVSV